MSIAVLRSPKHRQSFGMLVGHSEWMAVIRLFVRSYEREQP